MDLTPGICPDQHQMEEKPDTTPVRRVRILDKIAVFKRADCTRASRAARPGNQSITSRAESRTVVSHTESALKSLGLTLLLPRGGDISAKKLNELNAHSAVKGPSVRASSVSEQFALNHLVQLHGRTIDSSNSEPSWLLHGLSSTQCYDRLAESALRSNAVNSSVTKRRVTQGASLQTTRINCRGLGQAASSQCVNVAIAIAMAEAKLRGDGWRVKEPSATNAVDVCLLAPSQCGESGTYDDDELVCIVSTSQLTYNSSPTKLGAVSISSAAKILAEKELSCQHISERVASSNYMLTAICRSVSGGYEIDSNWASFVLVVYLSCDPRGRPLLRETGLTDLDIQTACAFELYGRGEITRRARLRAQQEPPTSVKRRKPSFPGDDEAVEDDSASIVHDSNEDDSSDEDLEGAECSSDEQILATKRKRACKGSANASSADAFGMLQWWFRALRSRDRSVLETLITSSKSTARSAACATLDTQAAGVSNNPAIRGLAQENATRSAQALVPFVQRAVGETPVWVATSTKEGGFSRNYPTLGVCAMPRAARTAVLHACRLPPTTLRPCAASGIGIAWSLAAQELSVRNVGVGGETSLVPGVAERHEMVGRLRAGATARASAAKTITVMSLLEAQIKCDTRRALPSVPSGVTRSFIALHTTLSVKQHTFHCAAEFASEGSHLANSLSGAELTQQENSVTGTRLLGSFRTEGGREEPYCTPAPKVAVGLRLNELLRRAMAGRTRKNEPCRVPLGFHTVGESTRDLPPILDTEPLPLATITNLKFRFSHKEVQQVSGSPVALVRGTLALHVCLDGAVRAPEMIAACSGNVWQQRALLYAGSSQASYIGDIGPSLSAGAANAAINSSKKISCADVNTLCLLSIWDVYGGGLTNVKRSFVNTPYSGSYGPLIDTGIVPPALMMHNHRSDKRSHGSMTLSTAVADAISARLSKKHFVRVGESKYVATPIPTRGIPHGFVPGVHSMAADYISAVDRTTVHHEEWKSETTRGLFSLPFSAFTQALRPDVESTTDSTLRYCFREPSEISCAVGKSYLPDSTCEEEAIVTEPLFRRPCQASVGDNPFATAYEHVDSVFNALNAIALIADCCGGVGQLHSLISRWHMSLRRFTSSSRELASTTSSAEWQWAADACVLLFGVIYPANHKIAENVVPECYALACAANARAARGAGSNTKSTDTRDKPLFSLVSKELFSQARGLWARCCTRESAICPWKVAIAPMLAQILRKRGSHEISLQDVATFRVALNKVCSSGAWLFYSKDGKQPPLPPNPASACTTPNDVRRPTLDPVFVGLGNSLQHAQQRGCLVGLKPFQLRQVYALLMGAHIDEVEVQACRNEGGLLLRESSLSTILDKNGKKRSVKGIAPTQTESDQTAYGSRKAKVYGAVLQMSAWDANALLQAPLFGAVDPPMSDEWLDAGEFGVCDSYRNSAERWESERKFKHPGEVQANRLLQKAVCSELTQRLHKTEV